ncbi:hypothetical protein OSB04_001686 [Centaurea solstitialis]|uniref:Uncharacterized protein n=1 Tax=Centaurea solstitialis TaxID=347529 RepID=A0AA38U357_9ASTR|nr:hypothetical protein OSB04_001686 [Centaurea solstitialis]
MFDAPRDREKLPIFVDSFRDARTPFATPNFNSNETLPNDVITLGSRAKLASTPYLVMICNGILTYITNLLQQSVILGKTLCYKDISIRFQLVSNYISNPSLSSTLMTTLVASSTRFNIWKLEVNASIIPPSLCCTTFDIRMERFLKRKTSIPESSSTPSMPCEIDLSDLSWDPADRKKIMEDHPNQRDEIRRKDHNERQCGSDAFVKDGFNSWNKTERLALHVGDINSFHNRALRRSEDLMRQERSIAVTFHNQTEMEKNEHRIRLNASVTACRFLLKNALPFRGHDESEISISKGMFSETLSLIGDCNDVDESSDVSKKEQMAVVLRYVDARGIVKERFFGIVHVTGTSSSILKSAIGTLFVEHGLSLKQIRGQGYDGASNMRREFNGLKALILNDNNSAYYIHCFAHQLQLVVVAVANKHDGVENFFNMLTMVVNVVNASCKRKDMLRQSYKDRVQKAISHEFIVTGSSKKDQDIVEAISLVRGTKHLLQTFRETGFDPFLKKMYCFCEVNGIELLDMAESYKKNVRLRTNITNRHYYEFDIFNTVVDMQLQEFGDRFSEVNTELLKYIAALSPCDSFSQFNVSDLLELSKLYPYDFDCMEMIAFEKELNMYYVIVCQDERFSDLSGIAELAKLMVDTKKHKTYPLVYRLLKLALVLPVASATVERCFSAMKIVKTDLRNKIGDEFLNDALICTIEKEALLNVTSDDVINQFQKMKSLVGRQEVRPPVKSCRQESLVGKTSPIGVVGCAEVVGGTLDLQCSNPLALIFGSSGLRGIGHTKYIQSIIQSSEIIPSERLALVRLDLGCL